MAKPVYFIAAVIILSIVHLGVACTQKATPVITSRIREPLKKEKLAFAIVPDVKQGEVVFRNRCGNCHDLPLPDQFTEKRWEGILSYMIPRARLNEEQGTHVSAYLKVNAAKQN